MNLEREQSTMARTPKVVEDRREQIIEAALRVFAEKGFARATNRDIAREAGITTGLIYYYFKSKEDLLKAALEEHSPIQVMAHTTPEMLELPLESFLPVLVTRILDVVENGPFLDLVRIVLPEVLHGSTSIEPIALDFFRRVIDFLSSYLQTQIARGKLRADLDARATAQLILSSLIGMVLRRQIVRDPSALQYSHEEIAQILLRTFGRGIQLP